MSETGLSVPKADLGTRGDFPAVGMDPDANVKCKIVVVGDSECGKSALLNVFAKDCFPEVRNVNVMCHSPACSRGRALTEGVSAVLRAHGV